MGKDRYEIKPWSGLAPAVDCHLARWDQLKRVQESAKMLRAVRSMPRTREGERQLEMACNLPILQAWSLFAMSYGVPDEHGMPQMTFAEIKEGNTISGRELFRSETATINMQAAGWFAIREYEMLSKAVTHYISAECCNEIEMAMVGGTCDPLFETDCFTKYGFALLEEPLLVNDLHPDTGLPHSDIWLPVRAMGWRWNERVLGSDNTIGPGVELFCYVAPEDYDAVYIPSLID